MFLILLQNLLQYFPNPSTSPTNTKMAQNTPLQDHYATLHITRPATPEALFLAFQTEMLALSNLPAEEVAERFDQVS
jgi:hypothetical protein